MGGKKNRNKEYRINPRQMVGINQHLCNAPEFEIN